MCSWPNTSALTRGVLNTRVPKRLIVCHWQCIEKDLNCKLMSSQMIYQTLIKAYINKPDEKKQEFLACLKKFIQRKGKKSNFCASCSTLCKQKNQNLHAKFFGKLSTKIDWGGKKTKQFFGQFQFFLGKFF